MLSVGVAEGKLVPLEQAVPLLLTEAEVLNVPEPEAVALREGELVTLLQLLAVNDALEQGDGLLVKANGGDGVPGPLMQAVEEAQELEEALVEP